jgi:curved DNA-binding protein CbpA
MMSRDLRDGVSMNYYEILEIDSGASKDDIERAFRKVARRVHPDLSKGDARAQKRMEERMKELNEIRDTLTDSLLRAGYDERLRLEALENPRHAAPPAPPRPAPAKSRANSRAKNQRSVDLGAPGEPTAEAASSWRRLGLLALGAAVVASAVIISLPHEGTPRAPAPPPTPALLPPPRPGAPTPPAPRPPRQGARARGVVHPGSTVDQVLRAFGTPDRIDRGVRPGDATFHYGKLKLEITNGRVTGGDAAVR